MATTARVNLDIDIGIDAVLAEIDRLIDSGVHPDRISVCDEAAVQWVCATQWVYYDGPDAACASRRVDAQVALLSLLLERGADPNKRKHRTRSALEVCCGQFVAHFQERALEKLALVLAAGGDPCQTKDPAICIALGLGEMRGEVIDLAFNCDAAPGHADAVYQAIELLLQAGADIQALDHRNMYTPVLMAAQMCSVPLLQFLVARGADAQASNPSGSNALMYAAGDVDGLNQSRAGISTSWQPKRNSEATIRQLLDWGLDPAAANARNRTPLRLAVNAGNLDAAVVLAEALAARGKLVAADVRLFRGTEYQERVASLTTTAPPKKPSKAKAAPDSAARRVTWERALKLINGPTDWQPNQYPQWLRSCLTDVVNYLGAGADLRVPPSILYLEYDSYFRSLRLSRTKSYLSRGGAVQMQVELTDWSSMRISYSLLEGDDWLLREAIDLPMAAGAPPSTQALCDAIGQLCARHLNTQN